MGINKKLKMLCTELCLGNLLSEPKQVFGGFLHKMYKVETETGVFAVKALNPQIMKRKTAMSNYLFSEKFASIVYESGIQALPAIEFNETKIHKISEQFFLIYQWFNGEALKEAVIDLEKCKIIGELLAKIHEVGKAMPSNNKDNNISNIEWNHYLDKMVNNNSELITLFSDNIELLYSIDQKANESIQKLSNSMVVSHRDLDKKNVLWDNNGNPLIIDWESSGYVNPLSELLEVGLYWSINGTDIPDKQAFINLVRSYKNNGGTINGNIEYGVYSIFKNKLKWLEYSIKRSLGIECNDKTEQELGYEQAIMSIKDIKNYFDLIPQILIWIDTAITT